MTAATARRRTRRVLMWLGLLPTLVAVLLVVKVGAMLYLNSAGRSAYADGEYADAADAFAAAGLVNVLEPWVAAYDEGTTAHQRGDYRSAVDLLEEALGEAPADEECRVRVNLALTHEALGDAVLADGEVGAAREEWVAGRAVLAEGDCELTAADETRRSLTKKLKQTKDAEVEEQRREDEQAAEEVEQRNEEAEERRRNRDQRQERPPTPPAGETEPTAPPTYYW